MAQLGCKSFVNNRRQRKSKSDCGNYAKEK